MPGAKPALRGEMNTSDGVNRRQFLSVISGSAAALAMPRFGVAASSHRRLAGVFPIAFTPISGNDEVDYDGLAAQMTFCRRGGVHGLAWPQLASGWSTLSEQERMRGAEVLVAAAKGGSTSIVIGVQSRADFPECERYARQAEMLGADAIICIPPAGVTDPAELLNFYQRLGAVTSLPLFAQAVGDFSVDLLVEMYEKIPTFRYVKDEAGEPLERVTEITRRTQGQLKCFSGRGVATMITEMERGFVGHCPYVSIADLYASAYDDYHAGRVRAAFDQFGRIQAAGTMFAQNDVNVLVARGVFRPGTTTRSAPAVPGAPAPRRARVSVEQIKHVLDTYLKPSLKA